MATTKNYNRKCPHCDGKWFLYTIKGKPIGSILGIIGLKESDTHVVCSYCEIGIQIPKQVIVHADRFEDTVVYE